MLKHTLVATLLAVTAFAHAGTASIGFEADKFNSKTPADSFGLSVIPGYTFDNGITVDAKLQNTRVQPTGVANSAEARVKKVFQFGAVGFGVRGGVGTVRANGDNQSFYSVEPSLSYDLTSAITAEVSYKYTNTFKATNDGRTNTVYGGVALKATPIDTFSAKVYRTTQDVDGTGVIVGYTRSF